MSEGAGDEAPLLSIGVPMGESERIEWCSLRVR